VGMWFCSREVNRGMFELKSRIEKYRPVRLLSSTAAPAYFAGHRPSGKRSERKQNRPCWCW
jgi:hypothetical protein